MSWAIAGDSLAVIGLLLLTFGTGAQAWANLAEFKSMRQTVSKATLAAFNDVISEAVEKRSGFDPLGLVLILRFMSSSMPRICLTTARFSTTSCGSTGRVAKFI